MTVSLKIVLFAITQKAGAILSPARHRRAGDHVTHQFMSSYYLNCSMYDTGYFIKKGVYNVNQKDAIFLFFLLTGIESEIIKCLNTGN
jgi:hypothetical protein